MAETNHPDTPEEAKIPKAEVPRARRNAHLIGKIAFSTTITLGAATAGNIAYTAYDYAVGASDPQHETNSKSHATRFGLLAGATTFSAAATGRIMDSEDDHTATIGDGDPQGGTPPLGMTEDPSAPVVIDVTKPDGRQR